MRFSILAAVDGSDAAFKALEFAIDFAKRFAGQLHVLYVAPEQAPPDTLRNYARAEHIPDTPSAIYHTIGDGILSAAVNQAEDAEVEDPVRAMAFGDPSKEILDYAAKHDINVIVTGSRGLGELRGLVLGSVSLKVSSLAPCTCIVVR